MRARIVPPLLGSCLGGIVTEVDYAAAGNTALFTNAQQLMQDPE